MATLPPPFAYEGEQRTVYRRRGDGVRGFEHERVCSVYCSECKRKDQSLMATIYRVQDALVVEKLAKIEYMVPAGTERSGVSNYMWMVGTVDTATVPIMCRNCRMQRAPLRWSTIVAHVEHGHTKKLKINTSGVVTL